MATKRKVKRGDGRPSVGPELVAALGSLRDAVRAGKRAPDDATVRTVERAAEPGVYDADGVRGVRELLGATQLGFAGMLCVSLDSVKSWETARREPSPLARRMMDEFVREPDRWRPVAATGEQAARERTRAALAALVKALNRLRLVGDDEAVDETMRALGSIRISHGRSRASRV